jgi:PAS domain S-box-containing protein
MAGSAMRLPRNMPNVLGRYGLALSWALLALFVRLAMPVPEGTTIYQLPLAAVVVSAWLGGRGPGYFAAAVCTIGVVHWFVPPANSWTVAPDYQLALGLFLVLCVLLVEFSAARWRVERELQESERRFRLMAEAVPQVLWFESIEPHAILYASPRFEHVWGRPIAELQRDPAAWLEAAHPEDKAEVRSAYARLIAGEAPGTLDATFRIVRPDGGLRTVHCRGTLIRDEDGRPYRASAIAEDITEAKRADEALATARAELARVARLTTLGQLAASIAHEVNQPLGAMVANAAACDYWLAAAQPETAKAQKVLKTIIADGQRASAVIGRIRAQLSRQPTSREALDINEVIRDALELARYELRRNRIVLESALAQGLPRVHADRVQLQQVLLNLVVNAIEATTPVDGPRQLVVASAADGATGVLVTVRDNGVGLDVQAVGDLFDPFYTTKPSGMGMGLAISRSTIESHGGRIWANPSSPRGAEFRFTLPAAPQPMAQAGQRA